MKNINPPDIRVEGFKRDLRRDLMRAASQPRPSRFGFWFASGMAGVMALLLLAFIINPEVPQRLNALVTDSEQAPVLVADTQPQKVEPSLLQSPQLQRMLVGGPAGAEIDRQFAESILPGISQGDRVEGIAEEKIYAIRRFKVRGGKEVVVYTELGPKKSQPVIVNY